MKSELMLVVIGRKMTVLKSEHILLMICKKIMEVKSKSFFTVQMNVFVVVDVVVVVGLDW